MKAAQHKDRYSPLWFSLTFCFLTAFEQHKFPEDAGVPASVQLWQQGREA